MYLNKKLIVLFACLLTPSWALANSKPTRNQALACFDQFMQYIERTRADPRILASTLVDAEAAAQIGSRLYSVPIEEARKRIRKVMSDQHSTAFAELDPKTITFSRQGRATRVNYANGTHEYVYELSGFYYRTDAVWPKNDNQSAPPRFTFVIWLRVKKPLCEAVDIVWQNAQLSWTVTRE